MRVRNNNKNEERERERERENRPGEGGLPSVGLGGVAMIISSEFYRTEMKKGKNKIESGNCGTIIIYKKRRVFNRKGGKALSLEVGFCSSRGSYYHFFYKLFIFWIIILLNFF